MMKQLYSPIDNWALHHQLMFFILIFNFVDFFTTKILIEHNGFGIETNLILYNAMVFFNSVWIILFMKLTSIGIAWLILYRFYKPNEHYVAKITLYVVLVVYIIISGFNIMVLMI